MELNSFGRRLSLRLAVALYVILSRIMFPSYRITFRGEGKSAMDERWRRDAPFIAAFWHYGVILFPYLSSDKKWVAMVSASKDGDYIARILEHLGQRAVRGSSNRQGVSALKNMLQWMRRKHNAAIVADGSKGPPRVAQPGLVLLAARTGFPVIPIAWSASSYWTFKSWDRTILPKPFARIYVECGPPIEVPEGVKGEAVEVHRQRMEKEIDAVYFAAWRQCGREEH